MAPDDQTHVQPPRDASCCGMRHGRPRTLTLVQSNDSLAAGNYFLMFVSLSPLYGSFSASESDKERKQLYSKVAATSLGVVRTVDISSGGRFDIFIYLVIAMRRRVAGSAYLCISRYYFGIMAKRNGLGRNARATGIARRRMFSERVGGGRASRTIVNSDGGHSEAAIRTC
ncbi:hypothetical protein KGM_205697 [Danaus plexippus plexippus]|uniref:Uncharacterized protein n=1 Tax=Danaus plexippus plexippus TaxID=278856 RepID=A0A212FEJ1_DANPL|nr:hypothetical protein KGM_205697 [Danaus plexippus plexippus]